MLSKEKNHLLCSVGPGSAMGEVFRSIWLPAMLSSQLPQPGCSPQRLKLLGEPLVAFRSGDGQVGVVQSQCAHRLAPLYFGRVEQAGIRCSYHGWLYDHSGQCLEIPSEPPESRVHRNMKLTAYPVVEKAGIIWIFMGRDPAPALPRFPWIDLPDGQRVASNWLHETNWVQGMEGEIDSSHVSILHRSKGQVNVATLVHRPWTFKDPKPKLYAYDTPIGFMSIARRRADADYYWRITQWMAPMFTLIPSATWPIGGRAWVPIDDENTYCWDFTYTQDGKDIPPDYWESIHNGDIFPPLMDFKHYRLNTGEYIDTWIPRCDLSNDYQVDRELQQDPKEMTGVHGIGDQDRMMQEGMGRISDRSREKLVAADLTVITARRKLLDIAGSPQALEQFRAIVADGSAYSSGPVDDVHPAEELPVFLKEHALL